MPHSASGGARLPHVNDLPPEAVTFMIADALAETYREVLEAPIPGSFMAILRRMETREAGHEHPPA